MNSSWKKMSRVYTTKRYQKFKKGKIEVIKENGPWKIFQIANIYTKINAYVRLSLRDYKLPNIKIVIGLIIWIYNNLQQKAASEEKGKHTEFLIFHKQQRTQHAALTNSKFKGMLVAWNQPWGNIYTTEVSDCYK